jgi:hypothetical protein
MNDKNDMLIDIKKLEICIEGIDDNHGGDIRFIPPISNDKIIEFTNKINWNLPEILVYFYTKISNGLIIGNKRILSVEDILQKKTFVDSLNRQNNPSLSFWFKNRPHIFDDYLIIGTDIQTCFCYSKKYSLENPNIYICENPNSSKGVDFNLLDLDLAELIYEMVENEFG